MKYILTLLIACNVVWLISCSEKAPGEKSIESIPKEKVDQKAEKIKATVENRPTINVNPNDFIVSPIKILVNSQGLWFAHEGELGTITLIDENQEELGSGILSATGEWMKQGPVAFSTILSFKSKDSKKGYLVVRNNPGPGEGEEAGVAKSFRIPVRFL